MCRERNPDNEEYHLFLTDDGKTIFEKHRAFEENCYQRTFEMLASVTEEELQAYIRVQALLNKALRWMVQESPDHVMSAVLLARVGQLPASQKIAHYIK